MNLKFFKFFFAKNTPLLTYLGLDTIYNCDYLHTMTNVDCLKIGKIFYFIFLIYDLAVCGMGSVLIYEVDISSHACQRWSFSQKQFAASTSAVLMQRIKMSYFC